MLKDAIVRFDTKTTTLVHRWPKWLRGFMLTVTHVGQPVILGLVAVIIGVIAWQNAKLGIVFGLAAGVFAMGVNSLLKHYIHRTRPDTLYVSKMFFKTSSFPSGHAFGATVLCGLFAWLAVTYLPAPWQLIAPVSLAAFTVAIGVSRVYLGAHFPTDVIAGWILGAVTVALIVRSGLV